MKIKFQHKITFLIVLVATQISFSQKKDENIGTEVVNVVKPYTPTISDAFKVKETPTLDDNETSQKKDIKYEIFSFPVASTFTPSKGKAAGVEKSKQEKMFDNYATLAAGNYGTVNAELFVTKTLENNDYVGVMLRHLSSQGGIKNVLLNDKYYNTSADATYGSRSKNLSWNADLGYQNQTYNWYGIAPDFFDQTTIDAINPKQSYQNIYVGGKLALGESILKDATVKFSRFSDKFGSGENRFVAKPSLQFDVLDQKINTNFIFDYLNGQFEKDYYAVSSIKYGYTNIGFQPSFNIKKDDFSFNIGASFFYTVATQSGANKFFVYPNITASYKLVGDLMIAYAGAEGGLKQNSYQEFVNENYYVSPTLNIAPTDQKFDIYVGLKGKLANAVAYNVRGSYINEDNKALFTRNEFTFLNTNKEGYAFGNSFNVIYDAVKTLSFFGELKADFSKNVTFGINGTFNSYAKANESEAWNLPNLKIGSTMDFTITPKWYAGLKLFFVGERKDQLKFIGFLTDVTDAKLNNYFDLNAHLGYKYNDRLTFFLKGNNLANQSYQKWVNYPVQGIQGLIGANYKFDF